LKDTISFEDYQKQAEQEAEDEAEHREWVRQLIEYSEKTAEQVSKLEQGLRDAFYAEDDVNVIHLGVMLDRVDAPNPYGCIGQATRHYRKGRYDAARQELDFALELEPGNKEVLLAMLDFMYYSANKDCESFAVDEIFMQRAFELYPDDPDMLKRQVLLSIEVLEDRNKGQRFYARLRGVSPAVAEEYAYLMGEPSMSAKIQHLAKKYLGDIEARDNTQELSHQ
jgi:hypothetical protein